MKREAFRGYGDLCMGTICYNAEILFEGVSVFTESNAERSTRGRAG